MQNAKTIITLLQKRGYPTYIVGGAVRDIILGREPHDIDLVTLASPDIVQKVARENNWKTIDVGSHFGVTIVVINNEIFEIAAARTEWYGTDAHKPAGIKYTQNIETDLSRRDFTINAMAMTLDGQIIDPFNGQKDLRNGLIKTVGNPDDRFAEDALRMFRALRFASKLEYRIESNTLSAISANRHKATGLSVERVRNEIEKILTSPRADIGLDLLIETGLNNVTCQYRENGTTKQVYIMPELNHLIELPQNSRYHCYDAWVHTLEVILDVPQDVTLRWAALLHDIAKGWPGVRCLNNRGEIADHGHEIVGAKMAQGILERLKVHPRISKKVIWLVRNHMNFPSRNKRAVTKWLRKHADNFKNKEDLSIAIDQLFVLREADIMAGKINSLNELNWLKENELTVSGLVHEVLQNTPFYRNELTVSGKEIVEALGEGKIVGNTLNSFLERIQFNGLQNTPPSLKNALRKKAARLKSVEGGSSCE